MKSPAPGKSKTPSTDFCGKQIRGHVRFENMRFPNTCGAQSFYWSKKRDVTWQDPEKKIRQYNQLYSARKNND
jgi:hypothetical protein